MNKRNLIKIGITNCPSISLTSEDFQYLNTKLEEVLSFFQIKYFTSINLFLFQNQSDYLKRYGTVTGQASLMGCYRFDNAYVYADLTKVPKEKFLSCIMHELIHIVYQNYVQEEGITKRVIWVSEGIAQNLSGEKNNLSDNNEFITFLQERIFAEGKIIPDISYFSKYGNSFGTLVDTKTQKYSGYDWSYLMIKYLQETLTSEEFQYFIRNYDYIKKYEHSILINTANYFQNILKKKTK